VKELKCQQVSHYWV